MTSRTSRRKPARRTAKTEAGAARTTRTLPPDWGTRSPTYEGRMKAAGFRKRDAPSAGIDAVRNAVARQIAMIINDWRGCPEPLCKRMRGCMAPHIRCTNARPAKADPEALARTIALVHRTLRELDDRRAAEEG
jgi:hypothetical protein